MSFMVTLTFDLHGADTKHYPQVEKELLAIDLRKDIKHGTRAKIKFCGRILVLKKSTRLPSNTYVAKFDENDLEHARDVAQRIGKELARILKSFGVPGRYFVVIGKSWAWQAGNIR